MRALLFLAALVLAITLAPAPTEARPARADCTYELGFRDLHDLIPEIVGDCLRDVEPQPNGDVLQASVNGLLVWRKADNWTAFTNGTMTWINGPCGVQSRPNDALLPFEIDPDAPCGEAESVTTYSESSVLDVLAVEGFDEIPAACGAEFWVQLSPEADENNVSCVAAELRARGASEDAAHFFEIHELFLDDFRELGRVDLGVTSAPWINMSRPNYVFLNGTPALISIWEVIPDDWQDAPGYAELLADTPGVFPWGEYASFEASEDLADGGQRISLIFPLMSCRVCAEVAAMPVDYLFDADGRLVETRIAPPLRP